MIQDTAHWRASLIVNIARYQRLRRQHWERQIAEWRDGEMPARFAMIQRDLLALDGLAGVW